MATTETMTIDERYKYLEIMRGRYKQAAGREEKGVLLDEMEKVTGLGRKHLISRMSGSKLKRKKRKQERGASYGAEVDAALAVIWEALDYSCAERMKGVLVYTAEQLARFEELRLSPKLKGQLEQISISTIRRHLPKRAGKQAQRARQRLQNVHQQNTPIERIPWDIKEPGHFELDPVHHCGERLEGEYVYTFQIVDVATGWSGRKAMLGRSYIVVADALYTLAQQIPSPPTANCTRTTEVSSLMPICCVS